MTLDDLRAAHPGLGFALYAYTPGGGVTLEVHDGAQVFEFSAATEAAAIEMAFPTPAVSQTPSSRGSASPTQRTLKPRFADGEVGGVVETSGVFD